MKIFKLTILINHKALLSLLFLLISSISFSQKKQADKFYLNAQYYRAIPKYEKAIKTTDIKSKQESLLKLADCYRIMGNYNQSEVCYKLAIAIGKVAPEVYYNFGNILKISLNIQLDCILYKIYFFFFF